MAMLVADFSESSHEDSNESSCYSDADMTAECMFCETQTPYVCGECGVAICSSACVAVHHGDARCMASLAITDGAGDDDDECALRTGLPFFGSKAKRTATATSADEIGEWHKEFEKFGPPSGGHADPNDDLIAGMREVLAEYEKIWHGQSGVTVSAPTAGKVRTLFKRATAPTEALTKNLLTADLVRRGMRALHIHAHDREGWEPKGLETHLENPADTVRRAQYVAEDCLILTVLVALPESRTDKTTFDWMHKDFIIAACKIAQRSIETMLPMCQTDARNPCTRRTYRKYIKRMQRMNASQEGLITRVKKAVHNRPGAQVSEQVMATVAAWEKLEQLVYGSRGIIAKDDQEKYRNRKVVYTSWFRLQSLAKGLEEFETFLRSVK